MSSENKSYQHLLELLNEGEELSVADIKEQVGVTDRQERRLINRLRRNGIPVRERREGKIKKFYLAEEDRHRDVHIVRMPERQIFALTVAAEASRAVLAPTPLGRDLEKAFGVLMREIEVYSFEPESEPEHWNFTNPHSAAINPAIFTALTRAIKKKQRVSIDYLTASTGKRSIGRMVEPYGMAVRNGSWLLVAFCREKKALRDFSLAGISRLDVREEDYFLHDDNFDLDAYLRPRFSALAGGEIHTVKLLVEPDRAEYFRRKSYHPTQNIEERRCDGRIVVSFRVAGLEEMRTFAQGWGVGVTVLEPGVLVARLRAEAEELAARYGDMPSGKRREE